MLIQSHDTDCRIATQSLPLLGDTWTTEVVPRLPTDLACGAGPCFQGLVAGARYRAPQDLLRGLLAYVLGPLSTRRLGAWAVLIGLADRSEVAWRNRLWASNDWLLWLLSALGLGLETLRQQVQGSWSEARLQACRPRLRRFLCSRHRRRGHQEFTVRAWLEQRARARPDQRQKVA